MRKIINKRELATFFSKAKKTFFFHIYLVCEIFKVLRKEHIEANNWNNDTSLKEIFLKCKKITYFPSFPRI